MYTYKYSTPWHALHASCFDFTSSSAGGHAGHTLPNSVHTLLSDIKCQVHKRSTRTRARVHKHTQKHTHTHTHTSKLKCIHTHAVKSQKREEGRTCEYARAFVFLTVRKRIFPPLFVPERFKPHTLTHTQVQTQGLQWKREQDRC